MDLFISPFNFKFVKFSSLKYEKDKKMTLTTQPIEEFSEHTKDAAEKKLYNQGYPRSLNFKRL